MGRRPKPLDPANPLHAFAVELRTLRDAAGASGLCDPTCERVGITRTTYYAWLGGKQLPGVDVLASRFHRGGCWSDHLNEKSAFELGG